jgi:hypothetical protein
MVVDSEFIGSVRVPIFTFQTNDPCDSIQRYAMFKRSRHVAVVSADPIPNLNCNSVIIALVESVVLIE